MNRWKVLAVAALLLLPVVACGSDDDEDGGAGEATEAGSTDDGGTAEETPPEDPVTIRMSKAATGSDNTLYVMAADIPELELNRGTWYELEELPESGNSAQQIQSMAGGQVDASTMGSVNALGAINQGLDIVIGAALFEERPDYDVTRWLVMDDSDIESAEDMEGKKIGVTAIGTPVYWIAKDYLAQAGLEEGDDYEFVAASLALQEESVRSGHIDVGVFSSSFGETAEASGDFRQVFDINDVQDPFIQRLLVFSSDFVDENRTAAVKFMEDFRAAADWAADPANHDQLVEIVAETIGTPADQLDLLRTDRDKYYVDSEALDVDTLQANWDWYSEVSGEGESSVEEHLDDDLNAVYEDAG